MDHPYRNSTGAATQSAQGGLSPNLSNNSNTGNPNATRYRASVDAARSLYSGGHQSLQPGGMAGLNTSNNTGGAGTSPRPGSTSKRPSSEMLASFAAGNMNAESDALDKWFEDLHHYEATLEEMAAASLDQSFKEELGAIEQWFKVLSEAERTAALYSLLQTSSQVQIRFFITVLQQMARCDPMNALLSPANPQQASMEAQMDAKLASLGLKTSASPAVRQLARQSLGAMPMGDAAGFLSPSSAMLPPPPRSSSTSTLNSNDSPQSSSAHDSADAATLLAAQRARLNAHATNRISAPGSLLSAYDASNSLRSPLWSQANTEQVAERASSRDGRSPSPDGRASNSNNRSRPASMISDHGLASSNAGNMANNLSPSLGSSENGNNTGGNQIHMTQLENGALSPLLQNQSWATMMNTPLMSTFGANPMSGQDGAFPRLDMSTNNNSNSSTWANQSTASMAANGIVLDDAKKFRRTGRSSDQGLTNSNSLNNAMNNMNLGAAGGNGNGNAASQQAAMAAQQNWRNMNVTNVPSAGNNTGSSDLTNLANLQAAMQQINAAAGAANSLNSPQMAMANLLAAQQQIQQQMQLQQFMAGMGPMGMMSNLQQQQQQQQMLSPVLGGMGLGMMPQSATSTSSHNVRRSPRPSDRATMGGTLHNALSGKTSGMANKDPSTGSGTNPDEPIDFNLLSDIPAWLKSLRLHKYTPNFEKDHWEKIILMTNNDLENKGVAALGARRKLLKVFENVRNAQGIPHPPGSEIPGEDGKTE